MGHTRDTCAIVPKNIQLKKCTRLLLDITLDFIAVLINSTPNIGKQPLLVQIERLLGALQPLRTLNEQAQRRRDPLPDKLKALSREVNSIVIFPSCLWSAKSAVFVNPQNLDLP